jgi:hypothetical protein
MDGSTDAQIGTTPAKVTLHRGINVCIAWFFIVAEQGHGTHDLSALAVAALRHL